MIFTIWTAWTVWIVMAAALAALEMITGTFYLLVLSLGAGGGALMAALGQPPAIQMAIAALMSIVGFFLLRKFHPTHGRGFSSSNPDVNPDVGSLVQISEVMSNGLARVEYRGATWQARVDVGIPETDLQYRIIRVEGSTLILEAN